MFPRDKPSDLVTPNFTKCYEILASQYLTQFGFSAVRRGTVNDGNV